MISVVIPVFNEEKGIKHNIKTIIKNIPCEFEMIIIDDGSSDNTWIKIKELSQEISSVRGIRFSKNFGKENALMAGINQSCGNAVITIDSDLQHPPKYIKKLIEKWNEGYKIVEIQKAERNKESFLYRTCAKTFYGVLKKLSNLDMNNSSDYKLIDREVVDEIKKFKEVQLFFRGIVDWVGYNKCVLKVEFEDRKIGKSKFKFKSLLKLAINAITSFSCSLLYITAFLGSAFFIATILIGIQAIVNKMIGNVLESYTIIILFQLLIGSLIMFCLAIIGLYVGKIYEEVKHRPQYIISEKI